MNIDLGSFAFGSYIASGGGTPSWGTSLGQSKPNYKFTYPGAEVILVGMVYCSVPLETVSLPLGKGGRIYRASELDECQIASLFRKVYINGKKINYPFVVVLVKEDSASHSGRKSIKYSDKNTYQSGRENYTNQEFIRQARIELGINENACWFVYNFEVYEQDELHMSAVIVDGDKSITYSNSSERRDSWLDLIPSEIETNTTRSPYIIKTDFPLQQIFYGAPGTGKSHRIKRDTAGMSIIRTTFHPDSDYSTFVGAYKPVMEDVEVRVVPVVLNNGASFEQNNGTLTEKRISYKFVKQAFLKAYLGAWKKYAEAEDGAEPQFLIIEEINRGNCAQIFGDLFQLLDRNDENDFSTYPIDADTDLQKEIEKAFKEEKDGESDNPYRLSKDIDVEGAVDSYISNYGASLSKDIQEGRVLLLPPNLYIWATMNTSDQSLFPIDSAFKRRWAWEYVKITDGKKGWMIQGADYSCDWWTFIQEINKKIATATSSDDKKLGYYFCKAKNNTICIDEKLFVSKVIFYLWNDVFKDNDNTIFKVTESTDEPSFDDFYMENEDGETVPKSSAVKQFLINVVGEENVSTVQSQTDEQEQTTQPTEQDLATQPTE